AAQGHVDLEREVGVDRADALDGGVLDLGRMAAGPQERQHEGGELMAERNRREADRHRRAFAAQREGRPALVVAIGVELDQVRRSLELVEQFPQLAGLLAVVERGDYLDRPREPLEVGLQLGFDIVIEHRCILYVWRLANGPAIAGPERQGSASWG